MSRNPAGGPADFDHQASSLSSSSTVDVKEPQEFVFIGVAAADPDLLPCLQIYNGQEMALPLQVQDVYALTNYSYPATRDNDIASISTTGFFAKKIDGRFVSLQVDANGDFLEAILDRVKMHFDLQLDATLIAEPHRLYICGQGARLVPHCR